MHVSLTKMSNTVSTDYFLDGQTSSGKTHTMLGSEGTKGLLEIAAEDLFKHMSMLDDRDFIVRVSFVEIYNEVFYDSDFVDIFL